MRSVFAGPASFNVPLTIFGKFGPMEDRTVTIKLPEPMIAALHDLAVRDDVSVGQLVRLALDKELRRRAEAKTPIRADERLVAPLRALLADDMAYAKS